MAVVINEFEVVPEPPAAASPRNPENAGTVSETEPKPDLERVLRHWHDRAERVRAH